MGKPGAILGAAALAAAGVAGPAAAQSYGDPSYPTPYGYAAERPAPGARPSYGYSQPPAYAAPRCCVAPAGMEVAVELVDAVGTNNAKAGDALRLRLAAPLIVDGQVVLRTGVPGVGHVVQASGPGLGGKGAKLVVVADYLTVQGGSVPLTGMQLTGTGKDRTVAADLASLGGWISMPLGFVGFAVPGGQIEIPAGVAASAKIARAVALRPLGLATQADYEQVQAVFGSPQSSHGAIAVPPPAPGYGQVLFFRARTLGAFEWFNVRENGQALGKLSSGAYFLVALRPGVHHFTASSEPEFKDRLTLKVDAGETYYVEGITTHGVVMGVADLTPSDKARFDAVSAQLQASARPAPSAG